MIALLSLALADDGVDGHHFKPVPGLGLPLDLVETWRIEAQPKLSFGISAVADFSSGGLVYVVEDWTGTTETTLLDDVIAANLGVRGSFGKRVAVAVQAPIYLHSVGPDGAQPAGLGDIRVAVPLGIVLPEESGLAVGVVPLLDLPTGDASHMLGNAGMGVGGVMSAGWHTPRFTADVNAGYEQLSEMSLYNLSGGGRLVANVGAGFAVTEGIGVSGELAFEHGLAKNAVAGTDSPLEALLAVRGRQKMGLFWTAGGGVGLTDGVGAPAYRGFAGLGWSYIDDPNRDPDQDGILGRDDACPRVPEVKNGWKDVDGCADALADLTIRVNDEEGTNLGNATVTIDGAAQTVSTDGSVAQVGRMPDAPVAVVAGAPGYVEQKLDLATLDEGANSRTLTLPWLPGTVRVIAHDQGGKPIPAAISFKGGAEVAGRTLDAAGRTQLVLPGGEWQILAQAQGFGTEGKVVKIDATKPGMTKVEFTLTPPKAEVVRQEVMILEAVQFDFNEATLRPDSEPLLRQVAGQLLAHPEVKKVEIQGHTDDVGNDAYNLDLSQRRVEAVMAWLVANGIAPERLVAKGYGESKPIASNGTEDGRAKNRRVQFKITEQEK